MSSATDKTVALAAKVVATWERLDRSREDIRSSTRLARLQEALGREGT
jgi:hypothetical protein